MRLATIQGHATSTIKHPSLSGWPLLVAVPESPDVAPQIVLDPLGAGIGQRVMLSSDGSEARRIVGSELSPVRWIVVGIVDEKGSE